MCKGSLVKFYKKYKTDGLAYKEGIKSGYANPDDRIND